jgi:casein kinase II subunit alpha
LKDLISGKHNYTKADIKHIIRQLLHSLAAVHNAGLIHRDVKPGNVIVDLNTFDVRLIDFGLAEFYFPGKAYNIRIATKPFKPAEILINHSKYFQSFDIWGLGNILGCLVTKMLTLI